MTDSLEHDSLEEAPEVRGKPLPLEPEVSERVMDMQDRRADMRERHKREDKPWLHWDNPAIWEAICGEIFDDE